MEKREVRVGKQISPNLRVKLVELFKQYADIFAWSYRDMPGLDREIVEHKLPLLPNSTPVHQQLRRMRPDVVLKIKEEVEKQWSVRFLAISNYPQWVANIVLVPKKDEKVRMCVDYRDLNRTSPKDNFPSPTSTLKSAGATYQRAMVTLFHDMMHKEIEVYVDDMIAKSKSLEQHIEDLQKLFARLRMYKLRLNPAKCTFCVKIGKLLSFVVNEKGIKVDSDKVKAIREMLAPRLDSEL
ncbi:putative protein K02A2.6, partial [Mucuna pruriens]